MVSRFWRAAIAYIAVFAMSIGSLTGVTAAQDATPVGSPVAEASPVAEDESGDADLDVLFIGAHPDDEAFALATYGQWNEYNDVEVGVITVTRGEGGGNAAGPEEGPALGIIREAEEREAVSAAGIEHIYNLDKVDFYYTVSAPLTADVWGYEETLEQVVRVIRQTKPEVITTMNPSPTPGNHGNHQEAARLAVGAYAVAGDPTQFPDQITVEGLEPWTPSKLYQGGATGEGTPGPDCASTYVKAEESDQVIGVFSGTVSEANDGRSWAAVARDGQRKYVSQGWSVFPDMPTDPNELTCGFFTLIDSRVPYTIDSAETTAALEGALVTSEGGLELGTQFYLQVDNYEVLAGQPFTATAHVVSNAFWPNVAVAVPEGWTVVGEGDLVEVDGEWTQDFTITPPVDAAANSRVRLVGTLTDGGDAGMTAEVVKVVPAVVAALEPLPNVLAFREWLSTTGQPQLDNLILPAFSMGVGQTRDVTIEVANVSDTEQSGSVELEVPAGFELDIASQPFDALAPSSSTLVVFSVTNTDATLPTSNEGGVEGNYEVVVTTTLGATSSSQPAALNLVPVTEIPQATTAPVVDGALGTGEYAGEDLDLSRLWEGDDPESAADASGTAKITWGEDGIYFGVTVVDDTLGTVLPTADAKRHWRTDSVEIAIDPLGTSENTSSTFKVGIFPTSAEGTPAAYRDADNVQGPAPETATGMEVASTLSEPYAGYVIETFVPYSALPADIDPANATINIFIYDSDTEDLTGQTRLGWSTWNGVQGDPYRWGKATFEGFTPAADARTTTDEPVIPLLAAQSANSPQSILQSAEDGVTLAGKPAVSDENALSIVGDPVFEEGLVTVTIATGAVTGDINVFLWDGTAVLASTTAWGLDGSEVTFRLDAGEATSGTILIGYESDEGQVQAMALPFGG
ncbi:MAG: sugar-binding protein [Thermomicrobiales bacterium]